MAWNTWGPSDEDRAKGLSFDETVSALVPDPSEVGAFFVMQGWLGPGVAEGVYRVYQTHALDEYYEIAREHVHHAVPVGEATRVWVVRGAPMRHVILRAEPAEVDYLSGAIAEQEAKRVAAGPPVEGLAGLGPTKCPTCPSVSP